jgi:hypothetical protein
MKDLVSTISILVLVGCQTTSMKAVLKDENGNTEVCEVTSFGITTGEKEMVQDCISRYKDKGYEVVSRQGMK